MHFLMLLALAVKPHRATKCHRKIFSRTTGPVAMKLGICITSCIANHHFGTFTLHLQKIKRKYPKQILHCSLGAQGSDQNLMVLLFISVLTYLQVPANQYGFEEQTNAIFEEFRPKGGIQQSKAAVFIGEPGALIRCQVELVYVCEFLYDSFLSSFHRIFTIKSLCLFR